jgi:hypothetical protein
MPQPSRPSSAQSTRSITVDPQHSRPRTATAPEMATGMVKGIPRRGRDYVPVVRTEKERHAARLRSQDFELAAISVKAGPFAKEEFERERTEARQRKMASDLEATLLTKLLARTPVGQRDSAAPRLLRGMFRHYDQDGDGTVTFDEFYHVASKLGMVTQPFDNPNPNLALTPSLTLTRSRSPSTTDYRRRRRSCACCTRSMTRADAAT